MVNLHPSQTPRGAPEGHFLGALLALSEPPPAGGGQAERPRAGPHARAPATPPPRAQGRRGVTRGDKGPTPAPGASRLRWPGGARRISGLGARGGARLPVAFKGVFGGGEGSGAGRVRVRLGARRREGREERE